MAKQLRCVVVTPEKAVLDEPVSFVAIPMYDGELGVLPGRAPLIGKLGFGELRTELGGKTKRYYVEGGFVQVRDDVVTLLTSKAVPAADLRAEAAEASLRAALAKTGESPEEQATLLATQQKARAQMRMIKKSAAEEEA